MQNNATAPVTYIMTISYILPQKTVKPASTTKMSNPKSK
jgi:hypothetical protein